ncbi:uncharacterized protein LOC116826459 [Chelonoidis abingdonii]|uniref:uncharacterized protein LOC116826459 n=1 Tax=Chelonoidis abingdonii TaxID=106734 RepID=UPI0013F24D8B|nr:uncharacterized protein LOC116826459 [Chelonoidis abingdonii]
MSMYKMPTEAKKPELPQGTPIRVQKRRPLYSYFANEKGLLLSPTFYPEIEPKKEEDFMEPQPFVKEKKDQVRKKLLSDLEKTELKAEVGMEEEPIYEDMTTEGPSQGSDVENQPIDPKSWKDGNIVTITKLRLYKITALVCDKWPTDAETEAHEEVAETMIDGALAGGDSETKDTNRVCSKRVSAVEPKEHVEEGATGPNGASAENDNDDSESDENIFRG